MEHVRATRAELLARREQIDLANQGRDLLEEKRNALMQEFLKTAAQVMRSSEALMEQIGEARVALALAQAIDGPESVNSAAIAAQGQVSLEVIITNIMGISVPAIEQKSVSRNPLDRGYNLTSVSSRVETAAEAFEDLLDLIIELAASEMRLRRLAEEIGRTTRRVNALEQVLIPRLESERDYIQMSLTEREREDHFRLKQVRKKLA